MRTSFLVSKCLELPLNLMNHYGIWYTRLSYGLYSTGYVSWFYCISRLGSTEQTDAHKHMYQHGVAIIRPARTNLQKCRKGCENDEGMKA